jgi:hypothetical protein
MYCLLSVVLPNVYVGYLLHTSFSASAVRPNFPFLISCVLGGRQNHAVRKAGGTNVRLLATAVQWVWLVAHAAGTWSGALGGLDRLLRLREVGDIVR